jgi:hypothetical protein
VDHDPNRSLRIHHRSIVVSTMHEDLITAARAATVEQDERLFRALVDCVEAVGRYAVVGRSSAGAIAALNELALLLDKTRQP